MFSLGIRYLMGWAMAAADGANKKVAEWPPHPDRVFMALAAAWFETGADAAEGAALRWLETLPAPSLAASGASQREIVTHYVPVNDARLATAKTIHGLAGNPRSELSNLKDAGLSQLPDFRVRQPRAFPVAIPHSPDVHLIWPEDVLDVHRTALASLCRRVNVVGHSASLVQMWLEPAPPRATLVPVSGLADRRMRVFGPGRLDDLAARHNRDAFIAYAELEERINASKGKEKKKLQAQMADRFPRGKPVSLRPEPGLWQGYAPPQPQTEPAPPGSVLDPRLVVLALKGKRLPLPASLKLTEALRGALLAACPEPVPEWVSGHQADGAPSRAPHIACLPLPFVGDEHADGRILGVALALPRAVSREEAGRVLGPWLYGGDGLPREIHLFAGQWLECRAQLESRDPPPVNLRGETWTGPARAWASVTPVVLDRHFDGADKWDRAAETVKDACERIGLPRPLEVLLHSVSLHEGAPRSNEFPWIRRRGDGGRMQHAHALIVFPKDVSGPVLVGAGRFRGYGLCRPLRQGGEAHG